MALTPKQEIFAQSIVEGMTQSDAYRKAYDAENMSDATIHNEASDLMKNPEVTMRLNALRAPVIAELEITQKGQIARYRHLSMQAEKAGQFAASIRAEDSISKAAGLVTDRLDINHGGTIEHSTFTPEERAAEIARRNQEG